MKKYFTLALFLAFSFIFPQFALSQFKTSNFRAIEKEKFADTEKKILKELQKKPNDVELNFTMAYLYITPKFENYNEETAYEYLRKAQNAYESITNEKLIKSLNKIPINPHIFENYTDTICGRAFGKAADINNVDAYENFLSVFKTAPEKYTRQVINLRNERKFENVVEGNSVEAYQDFINRFPDAKQIPQAITKRNALAFERTRRLDKIQDYREFISKYPDAREVNDAYNRIHELAFTQAERENTAASYKYFIDEYPSSKQFSKAFNMMEKRQFVENTTPGDWKKYRDFIKRFPENSWKGFAMDSILMIGTKSENIEILSFCVDNFTDDKRKNALLMLYEIFTADGEKQTLDMFYSRYDDEIFSDVKMIDYQYATIGDSLLKIIPNNINKPFYEKYIKEIAPKQKAYTVLRRYLSNEINTKNWSGAMEIVKSFSPYFKGKNKSLNELQYFLELLITAPKPQVKPLPPSETAPVVIPDNTPQNTNPQDNEKEVVPDENSTKTSEASAETEETSVPAESK